MSRQQFTWKPDLGAQQTNKPAVKVLKFGDGYEARVSSTINSQPKVWSLRITTNQATAQQILDFLEARGAVEAFDWTDPLDTPGVYVCREWEAAQSMFGVYQVSATFEQVFEY